MNRAFAFLALSLMACTAHKIAGARSIISEQSKCPEPEVFVHEVAQGYLGEGCNQSWLCSSGSGPCSKLSCEQVAQQERFSCRDNAERQTNYARSNVEVIVRGIEAAHMFDECNRQYDESVRRCAAPAPAPVITSWR